VTFEAGSVLQKISEYTFVQSGLKNISLPPSIGVIGTGAFL
jgi:hypothetical protein